MTTNRAALLTNVSNYLGNYIEGRSYKKFDFVFNDDDKLFYYAKEDISFVENFSITSSLRFTLDPNGPIYGGEQTYYIYDYDNNLSSLKIGQKINILSSEKDNNGSFLIIDIKENYSEQDVHPGDYILTEILDATERAGGNTFDSEWFLAGAKEFTWRGRNFEEYVLRDLNLKNQFEEAVNNGYSDGVWAWGKQHYEEYGEAENRTIPLNQGGDTIWFPWLSNSLETNITALNKNNTGSLNPNDKSLWFKFQGLPELRFFTKKVLNGLNSGLVWFEDSSRPTKEHVFYKNTLNVDFINQGSGSLSVQETIENIKFSKNGKRCVIKRESSIEVYQTLSSSMQKNWALLQSINIGTNFLLSAVSDDCSHLAYCTWPGSGVISELRLNDPGSGWLNGRSSGLQKDIKWVDSSGELYVVGALLTAFSSGLQLKIEGTVSQSGVGDSQGTFLLNIVNGSISSLDWISRPSFLSNAQPLEFSFQTYGRWVTSQGIISPFHGDQWVPLDQINQYHEIVDNYITPSSALGTYDIDVYNPSYFSDADINSGSWLSDPDYSVGGFLTIMSLNQNVSEGYSVKHHKPGFFYSVGNFTDDNSKLILASHNWSKDPEDSRSPKGRIMLIDVSSFAVELDIRGSESALPIEQIGFRETNIVLPDLGYARDIYFLRDEFISINKKVKNPVVISGDGQWVVFLEESISYLHVLKKKNGVYYHVASKKAYADWDSTISISGNNKVIALTNGNLVSWYINDNVDLELIRLDEIPSPPVNFDQIELDGSIDWLDTEYEVSTKVETGFNNWMREHILSKNVFGTTRIFVSSENHPDFYKNTYPFYVGSTCAVFDFDSSSKSWVQANLPNLPNFYWVTHIGGNESLTEIATINVRPAPSYPDVFTSFGNSSLRGLFMAAVESVDNYIFEKREGWALIEKSSPNEYARGYAFDIFTPDENNQPKWWSLKQGITSRDSFESLNYDITPTDYQNFLDLSNNEVEEYIDNFRKTRLWLKGYTQDDEIKNFEDRSSNILTIETENRQPGDGGLSGWTTDEFFFDPDYGSTVNYSANNYKQEFGNGYYCLQPKNINSLHFSADLKFKNRNSREANAIIHFLENKLGQHETKKVSNNLAYSQGISGFKWGGTSTFHPYDTTKTQVLNFYCFDFNHSLDFEDSNSLSVKLRNYDFSTIRMEDGGFVRRAEDYSSFGYYSKNDVVFVSEINRYYYYINDEPTIGIKPFKKSTDRYGRLIVEDMSPEYWTRDFTWKPSLGLTVDQKPRMQEISMGKGYSQVYGDGINESLLQLDLTFENRDDEECKAILHFLEQHKGYIPFVFTPPAPYDRKRGFVCQKWSHNYVYKNNHSIKVKFEEHSLNITADQRDNSITANQPFQSGEGRLVFNSPIAIRKENDFGVFAAHKRYRARTILKNVGGKPIDVYSIRGLPVASEGRLDGDFKINGAPDYDYASYVNVYPDLENYWITNISPVDGRSKYEWGKEHWEVHGGNTEFRIMPAKKFSFSQEFLNSEKTYNRIEFLYATILGRTTTSDQVNGWLNASGFDYMYQLVYEFMDSEEYKWNFIKYNSPTFTDSWFSEAKSEESITLAYQILLGRNPDSGGLAFYLNNEYIVRNHDVFVSLRLSNEFLLRINEPFAIGINSSVPLFTEGDLTKSELTFTLPSYDEENYVELVNSSGTLNLYGKLARIQKNSYKHGMEGGLNFEAIDPVTNQSLGKFIQRNDGRIVSISDPTRYLDTSYFINENFIKINSSKTLNPSEEKIFEIIFDAFEDETGGILTDQSGNEVGYTVGGEVGSVGISSTQEKFIGNIIVRSSAGEIRGRSVLYTS